jgi:predicted transcriptional regulator
MKTRMTVHFEPATLSRLDELAARRRLTKSAIIEAAVASYLSPDGSDRIEAAFARRLDRLSRQVERLERDVSISGEALALFVRFWLTVTPPLPDTAQTAAQAKGRERYEGFVETLGRRLAKGHSFFRETSQDVTSMPESVIADANHDNS